MHRIISSGQPFYKAAGIFGGGFYVVLGIVFNKGLIKQLLLFTFPPINDHHALTDNKADTVLVIVGDLGYEDHLEHR